MPPDYARRGVVRVQIHVVVICTEVLRPAGFGNDVHLITLVHIQAIYPNAGQNIQIVVHSFPVPTRPAPFPTRSARLSCIRRRPCGKWEAGPAYFISFGQLFTYYIYHEIYHESAHGRESGLESVEIHHAGEDTGDS